MAVPGILLTQAIAPVTDHMRSVMRSTNIPLVAVGIENTVRALGKLGWWSKRVGQVTPLETGEDTDSGAAPPRPITEREVLDYLAGRGVSTIPAKIVPSAEEAAQAAGSWSDATVLKVLSPDIQHKTEVGGVALNLQSPEAVANAFDAMSAAVRGARPDARIEGFIVSPMRSPGLEMLVGTMCDPQWGPVIVVGMGGVWVEVLKDTALRLLPVTRSEALDMVRSLKSVRLLEGYRGQPAIDMDALVDTIVAIGDAALALGDGLESLEVNPLRVGERGVEALDGVAVWKETHRKA
jgi:acyl-CoA synthetase (NDP forming)